jgi:hypothetical protein
MSADGLTLCQTGAGYRATKTIGADGSLKPFDAGMWFRFVPVAWQNFTDFYRRLSMAAPRPDILAVRGAPRPGLDLKALHRRLLHGLEATLDPVPRAWVSFDFDSLEAAGVDPLDGASAAAFVRATVMPVEWCDVCLAWQLTSGAGIKPGIRLRLWGLTSEPHGDDGVRAYLRTIPGVDASVAVTNQPNYVADPVLAAGAADPLGGRPRWGVLPGEHERAVIVPPTTTSRSSSPGAAAPGAATSATATAGGTLAERVQGIGPDSFRGATVAVVAWSAVAGISRERLASAIHDRFAWWLAQPELPPRRTRAELQGYLEELPRLIGWAYDDRSLGNLARWIRSGQPPIRVQARVFGEALRVLRSTPEQQRSPMAAAILAIAGSTLSAQQRAILARSVRMSL